MSLYKPHEPLGAVGIGEHPGAETLLDEFLLLAGGQRRLLVDDPLLAVAVFDRVVDHRRFHVQGQVEQPGAVGACGAVLGGGGDRLLGGVVGVEAPDGILFQVGDRDGGRIDVEQIGGECLDVACRYPRCTELGVDVAGQHVLGLHGPQGFGIAGVSRAGTLGGGELGPDVAGEIGVGRLPGFGFRVVEDQVAQFGDDLLLRACRRGWRCTAGPPCRVG